MKLIKNMMYNTVYQVLILILPLITAPYVSRTLGATGVGIYSSTAAWLGYFVLAGGLGITLYGNREIAYHQKDKEARSRIFYELLSLKFVTVVIALIAYLISQFHDVWLYEKIREKFPAKKFIWIRNNGSTMLSQLIDNLVFTTIAFYGVYPIDVMVNIFLSTYIIKFIVAICDTPFIYLADKMFRDKKIPEDI